MRTPLLSSLCVAIGLGLSQSALAMSLQDGFEKAKQHDQRYQAAKSALAAGLEVEPQAFGRLLPNVSLSSSRYRVEQQRTDNGIAARKQYYPSESDTLSLRQPLFNGRLFSGLDQAQASVAAYQAEFQVKQADLLNRYLTTYFNVIFTGKRERVVAAQLKSAESRLLAAQRGFQAGVGTRTDVNEVEAQRDLLLAQHLAARQALMSAVVELEVMVGQKIDPKDIDPNQSVVLASLEPGDWATWAEKIEKNNPGWVQKQQEELAARAALKVIESDHYPTLDLVAQVSRSSSENAYFVDTKTESRAIGVQLNVPIYQGGYLSSRSRQAAANLAQTQHDAMHALNIARLDGQRAYHAVREGIKRVQALENAQRSAELAVLANQKSFQAGVRSALDILNAEQKAAQTVSDLADAQIQLVLSVAKLRALAGEPIEPIMKMIQASIPASR